jgi:hypothetical protein
VTFLHAITAAGFHVPYALRSDGMFSDNAIRKLPAKNL